MDCDFQLPQKLSIIHDLNPTLIFLALALSKIDILLVLLHSVDIWFIFHISLH